MTFRQEQLNVAERVEPTYPLLPGAILEFEYRDSTTGMISLLTSQLRLIHHHPSGHQYETWSGHVLDRKVFKIVGYERDRSEQTDADRFAALKRMTRKP